MSSPEPNDPLDQLLRADAERYIDDAGFTMRVLEKLPARKHRNFARPVVFAAGLGAGLFVATRVIDFTQMNFGAEEFILAKLTRLPFAASIGVAVVTCVCAIAYHFYAELTGE